MVCFVLKHASPLIGELIWSNVRSPVCLDKKFTDSRHRVFELRLHELCQWLKFYKYMLSPFVVTEKPVMHPKGLWLFEHACPEATQHMKPYTLCMFQGFLLLAWALVAIVTTFSPPSQGRVSGYRRICTPSFSEKKKNDSLFDSYTYMYVKIKAL